MFNLYEDFKGHRYHFNLFFSTGAAMIVSLIICVALIWTGVINAERPGSVTVIVFLLLIPVAVFLGVSEKTQLRPAYYEKWKDKHMGRRDRKKILEQFARQYKIKDWKTSIDDIVADGRWKFHANTKYMYQLARDRNQAQNALYREYLQKKKEAKERILNSEKEIKNIEVELDALKAERDGIKVLLEKALSSGEVYQQRRDLEAINGKIITKETQLNEAKTDRDVEIGKEATLDKVYVSTFKDISVFYYNRYVKYTEIAVQKINKVNGLRYVIDDMPSAER